MARLGTALPLYRGPAINYISQVMYQLSIPVEFPHPAEDVFDAICDLSRFPTWARDVEYVSTTERMRAGLTFTTEARILGRINRSEITVQEFVPGSVIVLESQTGLVTFLARYNFIFIDEAHSRVVCNAHLSFSKAVFNLAGPVIEAVAETRIRGDLEALRALL